MARKPYWISVTKFFSGHTNIFMKIDFAYDLYDLDKSLYKMRGSGTAKFLGGIN